MKVSELAAELKKQNKDIIDKAALLGIDARGATKILSEAEVDMIRHGFDNSAIIAAEEKKARLMPRRIAKADVEEAERARAEAEAAEEEKRLRYDNVPYGDAFARLMELCFGQDHPYGHTPIGRMADLEAATLDDVRGFFHEHYQPANLTIALAGALEPATALESVERHFGDISAPVPQATRPVSSLGPLSGVPRHEVTADVPQDAIYCAWRVPAVTDASSDALGLGLSILTDGLAARFHQALVVPGLADSVDAFDLGLRHGNSLIGLVATCDEAASTEQVEAMLMATWTEMTATGPTAAELARAKVGEERDWLADLASPETRAEALAEAIVTYGDADFVNHHLDQVNAVTVDQVQTAFATHLAPANQAVLTYRRQK